MGWPTYMYWLAKDQRRAGAAASVRLLDRKFYYAVSWSLSWLRVGGAAQHYSSESMDSMAIQPCRIQCRLALHLAAGTGDACSATVSRTNVLCVSLRNGERVSTIVVALNL